MNIQLLQEMISQNYIRVNKHPDYDLYIYNYTQDVQFERLWNEITISCRGLILDREMKVVARPFPKFFNLGEMPEMEIPDASFEVFDKMDGSLGILYWAETIPYIASRGSFTSEQAVKATEMLHTQYKNCWEKLDPSKTYLFEIIYPENRIVLDYGTASELVLLAVIDTQTGNEFPLEAIGFPLVEKYDGIKDIHVLKEMEINNKEGFVICFANNFRLKVKFEEYLRLHRIITQVSNVDIWERLKDNESLSEILELVPDEFFNWVKDIQARLESDFKTIEDQCKKDFKVLGTRRDTAFYFQTCEHPAVLFLMLDNKAYDHEIWKRIRPEYGKPFFMESFSEFQRF